MGLLGEQAPTPWWPAHFLSPDFDYHVGFVAPRAPHLAKLRGATAAACVRHDENTGTRAYHLFRLPHLLEAQITDAATDQSVDANTLPTDSESAMSILTSFATDAPKTDGGAIKLGSIELISTSAGIGQLAGAYAAAFARQTPTYPYYAITS